MSDFTWSRKLQHRLLFITQQCDQRTELWLEVMPAVTRWSQECVTSKCEYVFLFVIPEVLIYIYIYVNISMYMYNSKCQTVYSNIGSFAE